MTISRFRTTSIFVAGIMLATPAVIALAGMHHPQIARAQKALDTAAMHLEKAKHDFGGHRAKALDLIKQAQAELVAAQDYASQHPEEFKKESAK
jgi:predicted translin family RNA/ssDNA-binding protein